MKSLNIYLSDINGEHYPLLTPEQEKEYGEIVIKGDTLENIRDYDDARGSLIKHNLRFVVKIAHNYKGLGLPLQDLISEGNLGLMKAAEKYNPNKGTKFSSYAAWWIKQKIKRALSNQAQNIRKPQLIHTQNSKINKAVQNYRNKYQKEPSIKDIIKLTGYSEKDILKIRRVMQAEISLNTFIREENSNDTLEDTLYNEEEAALEKEIDYEEVKSQLHSYINELNNKEQYVINKRYGLDGENQETLEQIAQTMSITRERVRQIQMHAIRKLSTRISKKNMG